MPDLMPNLMPGMIAAIEPVAAEEGAKVLKAGGNAIDAAVTAAAVQFIVDPQNCGLGGYAIANLHLSNLHLAGRGQPNLLLDAPAVAGSKATPDMWQDVYIGPNPEGQGFFLKDKVNDLGYQSICVPGTPLALATLLEQWGTISWADALAPAAAVAEQGFLVDLPLALRWKARAKHPGACSPLDYILGNAEARRIYLRDGAPYDTGDTLRNPDYGRTLRRLGASGVDDFYRGELAAAISADLDAGGSFVTAQDLAEYSLRDTQPLEGHYRGFRISTAPPPHGGATLLAILNILEGYDLAALGHNSPEYIYRVAMAMKAAFADRNAAMADPAFVHVPVEWMVSKQRAEQWRAQIDAGEPIAVRFAPAGAPDTTQVVAADDAGNCISLTHSLGAGSGVITPGLGFMYNNSMMNFYPLPGHPNSIAPGKGRTTGMAPTLVYQGDTPILVLGAPGATQIITSLVQVMLNILDFGMSVGDAVYAPRIDCQGDLIRAHIRIPEYVCAQVRDRHPIIRIPHAHGFFGRVCAIARDSQTGRLTGAVDAATAGMALSVP